MFLIVGSSESFSFEKTDDKTPEYKNIQKEYKKNIKQYAKTKKIPKNTIPEEDLVKMFSGKVFVVESDVSEIETNKENRDFFKLVE